MTYRGVNSAVEAVWSTLKRELAWIHGRRTWPTRNLLRSAIFDYVEGFYNPERMQKRLGYRSPAEFETASVALRNVRGEAGQLQSVTHCGTSVMPLMAH